MAPRKSESATKGSSAYVIPKETLDVFRERKKLKGILLAQTLADALAFAVRNRQVWW